MLAVVAERIVDSAILHLLKLWLKAPVIGEDKGGTRKYVGGGKANSRGTPQGGVISPLLANCYPCIFWIGYGTGINCAGSCKRTSSAMRTILWCYAGAE